MREKTSRWWLPMLAFAGALVVGLGFVHLNHSVRLKDAQLERQELLADVASSIERRFAHTLSSTYILAQEVRRAGGVIGGMSGRAEGRHPPDVRRVVRRSGEIVRDPAPPPMSADTTGGSPSLVRKRPSRVPGGRGTANEGW